MSGPTRCWLARIAGLAVLGCGAALLPAAGAVAQEAAIPETERRAVELSQAALGRVPDDMRFIDSRGQSRSLAEFRGRPVVVSLVFTGCAYACSVTTRYLDRVVREARAALGQSSFTVLTIGFDTPVDTPEAMQGFARRHAIVDPDWHFLASDEAEAMAALMQQFGVLSQPSSRGFDHTVQLSLLDREGRIYRQVYGETFPTPQLVEPLKDLVWGRPAPDASVLDRLQDRVRLFCTVYDPKSDRYYFDYSLFVGIFIGMAFLGFVTVWLLREMLFARRRRSA